MLFPSRSMTVAPGPSWKLVTIVAFGLALACGLSLAIQLERILSAPHIRRRGLSLLSAWISSSRPRQTVSSISSCASSRSFGFAHVSRLKSAGETPSSRGS